MAMTHRECVRRILNYQPADHVPVIQFGFLDETLQKWVKEGHVTQEEVRGYTDGTSLDVALSKKLGFDMNWNVTLKPCGPLVPAFQPRVIERFPDGSYTMLTGEGLTVLFRPGARSIQPDMDHLLKDRAAWEEHYLPRLRFSPDRIQKAKIRVGDRMVAFDEGGGDFLRKGERDYPIGLFCGSLYGWMRNWLTMEGACYLLVDDEKLFDEIIETVANLMYDCTKAALETGAKFDFAHFWEDICFKNGPLISPKVFDAKVGPHYKRITDLLKRHGIGIVSLDCDGLIDALVPTWIHNGVNTMFPIEVGTWGASIAPWRKKYGRELRGVGGMDKRVFAKDFKAVDAEIKRLKRLMEMGGYIPCPDHRIADDAKWDNVRYYCDRMHKISG